MQGVKAIFESYEDLRRDVGFVREELSDAALETLHWLIVVILGED